MARTSAMYTGKSTTTDRAVRNRYQPMRVPRLRISSAAIVHPPFEQEELAEGDQQGHAEQPERQAGTHGGGRPRPVLDDLEHQRLGGVHRAAPGEDVHLGVGLE